MRGFTKDGWVRVQRTVLRRVVGDRLQALLRGDFYVRNHLGEEDYDPILKEVAALNVPLNTPTTIFANGQTNGVYTHSTNDTNGNNTAQQQQQQPQSLPEPHKFTTELETFVQLIAASIMIDASMRGENAGESDTRFIKKKKKLIAKTLQGPKLGDFRKEVLRFDMIRRGEKFEEEEIVESEETRSSESESESESEEDETEFEERRRKNKKKLLKKPLPKQQQQPPPVPLYTHMPPKQYSGGESSSDEDDDDDEEHSTISDTATSNTSLSQDGFSTSATSSKHQKKKDKKRLKKERKKEKKRLKKEKRRRDKEERKQRRKRKLEEKERAKAAKAAKKRKKHHHGGNEEVALSFADNEMSDAANVGGDAAGDESMDVTDNHRREESGTTEDIAPVYEIATKADFEQYKEDVLSRVPKSVKSRFREGAFSRWGKDWLPVLELGPFDVEPGPVRDMWLEMFDNTQDNGRDMTRLVFWYGVKFEDRGQAYSFVPETKLIKFEEGERRGFCKLPKKIQKKVEKKQKLTKTEEQIKRGLKEIVGDMEREKPDRAAWMMQFQEDHEFMEEEPVRDVAEPKPKAAPVGETEVSEQPQEVLIPKKRKPGRPKKEESAAIAAIDKPIKRKPGRPKKVVDVPLPPEEHDAVKVKKKGPGRPKKTDKEKAEKASAKAEKAVAKEAIKVAAKEAAKAAARAEKAAIKEAAKAAAKAKKSPAKKWLMVDEDQQSETESEDDNNDRDYDFDVDSGDDGDMDVDAHAKDEDSDAGASNKRKADDSPEKKFKKKPKTVMTEKEKAIERRAKAAEYREKKAREKAEAQGLEYVKGRVGRKSKQTMLEEEQQKFTKCEEVFLPMMDRLTEAKDESHVKGALKWINSIMDRVELLTPPFLREYPLGMLMKTVRKSFEGVHPEVKEKSKRLTIEMKRVYTEKEKKVPEGFEPVKNKKSTPKHELQEDEKPETLDVFKSERLIESEKIAAKSDKIPSKKEKVVLKEEKVEIPVEQSIPKRNTSEMSLISKRNAPEMNSIPKRNSSEKSLSEAVPRKMGAASSSECLSEALKPESLPMVPKQKKTFSIKGMFEKPKPAPKARIVAPMSHMVVLGQPSPKPKLLPSWVTGPAVKMEAFHEQHAKERSFGLDFLVDAASSVTTSSTKKFDPISVSQSFELAIFAETKLRGRDWPQYWEKVHDVVTMLSPGKNKRNAILQRIISGDYQEPSELVKLSRREIQSLNQLKS